MKDDLTRLGWFVVLVVLPLCGAAAILYGLYFVLG